MIKNIFRIINKWEGVGGGVGGVEGLGVQISIGGEFKKLRSEGDVYLALKSAVLRERELITDAFL